MGNSDRLPPHIETLDTSQAIQMDFNGRQGELHKQLRWTSIGYNVDLEVSQVNCNGNSDKPPVHIEWTLDTPEVCTWHSIWTLTADKVNFTAAQMDFQCILSRLQYAIHIDYNGRQGGLHRSLIKISSAYRVKSIYSTDNPDNLQRQTRLTSWAVHMDFECISSGLQRQFEE
uniref:Uncharacterized protein n=1 Tax=Ditylenchus dipsaci TaxID=166011 RepID=A0A915DJD8_9BILA